MGEAPGILPPRFLVFPGCFPIFLSRSVSTATGVALGPSAPIGSANPLMANVTVAVRRSDEWFDHRVVHRSVGEGLDLTH
jgi:hypothetical protein